jgi:flagella basal body P-ring formation protein FlgA
MFIVPLFVFIVALSASASGNLMEGLIAEAWQPQKVRVEWTFSGKLPSILEQYTDWQLAQPLPSRLAGSLTLKLERILSDKKKEQVIVSGRARIFGESLTISQTIPSGQSLSVSYLDTTELEWTLLSSLAISVGFQCENARAAKTLVPGRVITESDLEPIPLVKQGQQVNLEFKDGAVRVVMVGRALHDGAIGDIIPVSVRLGRERRLQGRVQSNGLVQLVL